MANYDIFNGDADGICALHQLRLAEPRESTLVTGVKRDINLLGKVKAQAGDLLTVLDISLDKNREGLEAALAEGASAIYFDHHFAGEIPTHPGLEAHIDTAADTCTSLLVNDYLDGAHRPWAVTAAFGDNLFDSAVRAAEPLGYDEAQLEALKELGILINYNGYGVTLEDLYFAPADLYQRIQPYADPFAFINEDEAFKTLQQGYASDMAQANALSAELETEHCALFMMPEADWTRRVSGVFGNDLAQRYPQRAHAMLSELPGGGYRISVRAPLATKEGADELCRAFPTGGGRKAAAGINELPVDQYDSFVDKFKATFTP